MSDQRLSSKYRFPWQQGNHFELLIDGQTFFRRMLDDIYQAQTLIYLEMYLFESGGLANRFIQAFEDARRRDVNIYILLDDYGCRGLKQTDRERLQTAGVQIYFYNPLRYGHFRRNFFRDHRKLMVVDSNVAYTGGAGITDDFDPQHHPQRYWHEAMIRIVGPCVNDWQTLFEDNWGKGSDLSLPVRPSRPWLDSELGPCCGRVVESRSITHSEVIRSITTHIRQGRQRIWLATAYFVPSRKLRRALKKQALAGTDVRLLLPGPHSDHPWARHMGRNYYDKLLRHGVRIFEYQPRFTHVKILLCDDWVSIGSSNIDRWNFKWNLEANQEVISNSFANHVAERFMQDFADSHEILAAEWRQRPWLTRLRERFWGRMARMLSYFTFSRKRKR